MFNKFFIFDYGLLQMSYFVFLIWKALFTWGNRA